MGIVAELPEPAIKSGASDNDMQAKKPSGLERSGMNIQSSVVQGGFDSVEGPGALEVAYGDPSSYNSASKTANCSSGGDDYNNLADVPGERLGASVLTEVQSAHVVYDGADVPGDHLGVSVLAEAQSTDVESDSASVDCCSSQMQITSEPAAQVANLGIESGKHVLSASSDIKSSAGDVLGGLPSVEALVGIESNNVEMIEIVNMELEQLQIPMSSFTDVNSTKGNQEVLYYVR